MNDRQFGDNPHYVAYEAMLRDLHRLVAEGKGASPEAAEVRERMTIPEEYLSPAEIRRLNGLSSDLYTLHEQPEVYEEADPNVWTPDCILAAFKERWDRQQWEDALCVLRKGPSPLEPAQVAYFRGAAYDKLGHKETGLLFTKRAVNLNPDNPRYHALVLEALIEFGRLDQTLMMVETFERNPKTEPALLIESGSVLYRAAGSHPDGRGRATYERAAAVLRQAIHRAEGLPGTPPDVLILGHVILGAALEELDRPLEARDTYAAALRIDPRNEVVLLALGNLRSHVARLGQSNEAPAGAPRNPAGADPAELRRERRNLVNGLRLANVP